MFEIDALTALVFVALALSIITYALVFSVDTLKEKTTTFTEVSKFIGQKEYCVEYSEFENKLVNTCPDDFVP